MHDMSKAAAYREREPESEPASDSRSLVLSTKSCDTLCAQDGVPASRK